MSFKVCLRPVAKCHPSLAQAANYSFFGRDIYGWEGDFGIFSTFNLFHALGGVGLGGGSDLTITSHLGKVRYLGIGVSGS